MDVKEKTTYSAKLEESSEATTSAYVATKGPVLMATYICI